MTSRFKYPKTPHLPWSPSKKSSDDLLLQDCKVFAGKEIVITEKLDGENTSMYSDYIHARSTTSKHHPSRDWVKTFHASIAHLIPNDWRLCGENLYAKHSIHYTNLASYFYLFSVWDETNRCLNWHQTLEWAKLLDLQTPQELYLGPWNEKVIKELSVDSDHCEGFVVRLTSDFHYKDFSQSVAKWVRQSHLQTDDNWKHQQIVPNKLKGSH